MPAGKFVDRQALKALRRPTEHVRDEGNLLFD